MADHSIRLLGEGFDGAKISGPLLAELLTFVSHGVTKAVRLAVEGRSTARGKQPPWLTRSAEFDFLGLASGSTAVVVSAMPLRDLAAEKFGQQEALSRWDPASDGPSMLWASMEAAINQDLESDAYDVSLIDTLESIEKVFEYGVDAIEIARASRGALLVDRSSVSRIHDLRAKVPSTRRVRVMGIVGAIDTDLGFTLTVAGDRRVRGVAPDSETLDFLHQRFKADVVVDGEGYFRPSGSLRLIEARSVQLPEDCDDVFAEEPQSLFALQVSSLPSAAGGLSAIIGRWPGDETDAEIEEELRRLR